MSEKKLKRYEVSYPTMGEAYVEVEAHSPEEAVEEAGKVQDDELHYEPSHTPERDEPNVTEL